MSICEACNKSFDFPDYIEFHEIHWEDPEPVSPKAGESYPGGFTAVCPFCGVALYHRDKNHYPNKEAEDP